MRYGLYAIAAFEILAALFAVGTIGKPRKTNTPGSAVATVIVCAGLATVLILAAGQVPS